MKKTFLLLVGVFCSFALYGAGTVEMKPGIKIRNAKLNQLLGSVSKIEDTDTGCDNSQDLIDAINSVKVYENTESIHELLNFFNPINFGYNPSFADHVFNNEFHPFTIDRKTAARGNVHMHYINQGIELVSDVAKDFREDLYFVVPNSINSKYSLSIFMNNKEYSPLLVKDDGSYSMFLINQLIKDIKDNQEIKIVFHSKSEMPDDKIELTYEITPIEKDIFEKTVAALDCLDKSLCIENPHVAYELGNYVYEKNDKSLDSGKLSIVYERVTKDFNNKGYDLFNSKFALYENDSFITGLKSIYLSSINKTATFDSKGDVIFTEKILKY